MNGGSTPHCPPRDQSAIAQHHFITRPGAEFPEQFPAGCLKAIEVAIVTAYKQVVFPINRRKSDGRLCVKNPLALAGCGFQGMHCAIHTAAKPNHITNSDGLMGEIKHHAA